MPEVGGTGRNRPNAESRSRDSYSADNLALGETSLGVASVAEDHDQHRDLTQLRVIILV